MRDCPFSFADRFSGAVVHLTTSDLFQIAFCFTEYADILLSEAKTLEYLENQIIGMQYEAQSTAIHQYCCALQRSNAP